MTLNGISKCVFVSGGPLLTLILTGHFPLITVTVSDSLCEMFSS